MITIAEASTDDLDVLAELLGVLFAQEPEFSPDPAKQRAGLKLIIDDAAMGRILVARSEGQVVGMVNLLFTVSTALGKRVAILDDLIVQPAARGGGIGRMLMTAANDFCAAHGYARISLQTDFDNFTAHRLYESCGYVRSTMIPFRKLI